MYFLQFSFFSQVMWQGGNCHWDDGNANGQVTNKHSLFNFNQSKFTSFNVKRCRNADIQKCREAVFRESHLSLLALYSVCLYLQRQHMHTSMKSKLILSHLFSRPWSLFSFSLTYCLACFIFSLCLWFHPYISFYSLFTPNHFTPLCHICFISSRNICNRICR